MTDLTAKERTKVASLLRRGYEVEAIKLVRDCGGYDEDGRLLRSLRGAVDIVNGVRKSLAASGEKLPPSMTRLIRAGRIDV